MHARERFINFGVQQRNNLSPGIISFWRRRQQRLSVSKFEEVVLPGSLTGVFTIEYPTGIKIHLTQPSISL